MTDASGSNTRQPAGANFSALFPSEGVAVGALNSTGDLVPLSVDSTGALITSGGGGGGGSVNLIQVSGSTITLGAAASIASLPVVIATNQAAIPITGSISATNPSVGTTGTTVPAEATYLGINIAGSMQGLTGLNIVGTTYVAQTDLSSVGGSAVVLGSLGQQAMASSLPVAIASNQSALTTIISNASVTTLISNASVTTLISNASVTTLISNASLTANLTQVSGVSLTLGSGHMASSIPVTIATDQATVTVNLGQVFGTATATAGIAGLLAIGGPIATGASVGAAYPVLVGGRTQTGEIASTSTGQTAFSALDKVGKQIQLPYANPENFTSGMASTQATTGINIIASTNATNRLYLTSLQFGNTSGTNVLITANVPNSTGGWIVPAGGGNNMTFPVPIQMGLGSALVATCNTAVATVYMAAQAFIGQ